MSSRVQIGAWTEGLTTWDEEQTADHPKSGSLMQITPTEQQTHTPPMQTLQESNEACPKDSAAHDESRCMGAGLTASRTSVAGVTDAMAGVAEDNAGVGGSKRHAKAAAPSQHTCRARTEYTEVRQQYSSAAGRMQIRTGDLLNISQVMKSCSEQRT